MRKESSNEVLAFLLLGLTAFLAVCLYTWNPGDLGPGNEAAANICGPVGAMLSEWFMSWIGRIGSYVLTIILALTGICMFFRLEVRQPGWKIFGSLCLILSLATFEVAIHRNAGSPDFLAGGYFGYTIFEFLFANLHIVGTYLLLALITVVAFAVSTDAELYPAFAYAYRLANGSKRWRDAVGETGGRVVGTLQAGALSLFKIASRFKPEPRSGPEIVLPERKPRQKTFKPDKEKADKKPSREQEPEAAELPEMEEEPERPPLIINVPEQKKPAKKRKIKAKKNTGSYELPSLELLDERPENTAHTDSDTLKKKAEKIEQALESYGIHGAKVVKVRPGPTVTLFELTLAAGTKVNQIDNLDKDLQLQLSATSIRIIAPIPGKDTVGIEVPNRERPIIGLREILEDAMEEAGEKIIPVCIGKDTAAQVIISDISEMPHALIAGATGSGKSVFINSLLVNLLLTKTPDELKMIMIDPKVVELKPFENIPHLYCPIITSAKKAPPVLSWLVGEMKSRYTLLGDVRVKNIVEYNKLGKKKIFERLKEAKRSNEEAEAEKEKLPYIVLVIDELADLMMAAGKDVEGHITRLTQLSRAVGIHLIVATQRPSVNVITGLIKSNMPTRISFKVTQRIDSRTILDDKGADKLIGNGDMLYKDANSEALLRTQGSYLTDKEINRVIDHVVGQGEQDFDESLTKCSIDGITEEDSTDELYEEAVKVVLEKQRGSTTLLQRSFSIGYSRASRLVEAMEVQGLVGPHVGPKAREVYYTWEEYQAGKAKALGDAQETEEEPEESDIPLESTEKISDNEAPLEDSDDFEEDEPDQETSDETTELDDDQ
ncbi:MAG: DNA translocase FtsK [Planctomycetota bacterium]|nr:DNA translocase FtsK [Planctomycetota bacterium]